MTKIVKLENIRKYIYEATDYIDDHLDHYSYLLNEYVKNENPGIQINERSRKTMLLLNGFVSLFDDLKSFSTNPEYKNINELIKKITIYSTIFGEINSNIDITEHQKVDILTIKTYAKLIVKLLKSIKSDDSLYKFSNNTTLNSNTESSSHIDQTIIPDSTTMSNISSLSTNKLSDSVQHTSITSMSKIKNKAQNKIFKSFKSTLDKIPELETDTDQYSDKYINKQNQPVNHLDLLKRNKASLKIAISGIKNIYQLMAIIDLIFVEMQKEYLKKINSYSLYNPSLNVNLNDVEYNNKLLSTSYEQMSSLIKNSENKLFNLDTDTQPITAFLDDGTTFTLCTIDNFRFRLETINGFQYIIITIGTNQYKIKFLKSSIDNSEAVAIMRENHSMLKSVIEAIKLNQKLILYWLNILKKSY